MTHLRSFVLLTAVALFTCPAPSAGAAPAFIGDARIELLFRGIESAGDRAFTVLEVRNLETEPLEGIQAEVRYIQIDEHSGAHSVSAEGRAEATDSLLMPGARTTIRIAHQYAVGMRQQDAALSVRHANGRTIQPLAPSFFEGDARLNMTAVRLEYVADEAVTFVSVTNLEMLPIEGLIVTVRYFDAQGYSLADGWTEVTEALKPGVEYTIEVVHEYSDQLGDARISARHKHGSAVRYPR